MSTNYTTELTAPAKRQSIGKRAAVAALLSGGMALAGLGLTSGTAQAQPAPAPQHYEYDYEYCSWAFWD